VGVDLSIEAEQAAEEIRQFIARAVARADAAGAVLGLSGGLDSATVAYLAAGALGPGRVWPFLLPYRASSPESGAGARLVAEALGVPLTVLDVSPQVDAYFACVGHPTPIRLGNKIARERMSILYDQAKAKGALVLGTGNRSERLLGYTTVWGDMACDLAPLGHLYKTEVRRLAAALGVPRAIIEKPPTADLWPGQTDEGELGITYQRADELLVLLVDRRMRERDVLALGYGQEEVRLVRRWVRRGAHKRRLPPCPRGARRG